MIIRPSGPIAARTASINSASRRCAWTCAPSGVASRCDRHRQLAKGFTETCAAAGKDGILEGSSGVVRGEAAGTDAEYAGRGVVIVVFADDNDNLRCVVPPETCAADHAARRGLAGLGDHVDAPMHIATGGQQAPGFDVTSNGVGKVGRYGYAIHTCVSTTLLFRWIEQVQSLCVYKLGLRIDHRQLQCDCLGCE